MVIDQFLAGMTLVSLSLVLGAGVVQTVRNTRATELTIKVMTYGEPPVGYDSNWRLKL